MIIKYKCKEDAQILFFMVPYYISMAIQHLVHLCLVLLQVPKCFVPVQIFWASPKISLHLVHFQKLLCRYKNQFYWMQFIFLSGTKCLSLALNALKFLGWLKKFWPAQNILGPVKGQGINDISFKISTGLLSMKGKDKNETIYFQMIIWADYFVLHRDIIVRQYKEIKWSSLFRYE